MDVFNDWGGPDCYCNHLNVISEFVASGIGRLSPTHLAKVPGLVIDVILGKPSQILEEHGEELDIHR